MLVNVRGTLGGVAVASPEMVGWNVSREVAVVPADPGRIIPSYLAYCIGSKASQDWLTGVQKGAAYSGINIADLRELTIPVPPKSAQSEVVSRMSAVRAQSLRLEKIALAKLDALAELKQSLLQRAFDGELT